MGMSAGWTGLLFCGLLAAETSAQGPSEIVLPHGSGVAGNLATREGNHALHVPVYYSPSRVQTVYRGADLALGKQGMRVVALALRRDGVKTSTYVAHTLGITVRMSSQGVELPSHARTDSFAANHGKDETVVFDSDNFHFPALPRPSTPPAAFAIELKLDKPFLIQTGANVCIEIASRTPNNQSSRAYWYVDSESFSRTGAGKSTTFGRGCPFGFQAYAEVPPLDGETKLSSYAYTRYLHATGGKALLLLGDSKTSWAARALPFDLAAFGANGCQLYTNPVNIVIGHTIPTDPRGLVRFQVDLPRVASLQGRTAYEQVLVYDPTANPLGLRTSNGVELHLGRFADPLPARTLYHSSSNTADVPTKAIDEGLVVRLRR